LCTVRLLLAHLQNQLCAGGSRSPCNICSDPEANWNSVDVVCCRLSPPQSCTYSINWQVKWRKECQVFYWDQGRRRPFIALDLLVLVCNGIGDISILKNGRRWRCYFIVLAQVPLTQFCPLLLLLGERHCRAITVFAATVHQTKAPSPIPILAWASFNKSGT
jgi:hypothetical protein